MHGLTALRPDRAARRASALSCLGQTFVIKTRNTERSTTVALFLASLLARVLAPAVQHGSHNH
jgi:hypothetical protein